LESTGDNEISMIHGYKIGSKLGREVILLIQFFPVNVRFRILCLLEGMGYGALQRKGMHENYSVVQVAKIIDQMQQESEEIKRISSDKPG
jgi:hypothetical protein